MFFSDQSNVVQRLPSLLFIVFHKLVIIGPVDEIIGIAFNPFLNSLHQHHNTSKGYRGKEKRGDDA